MKNKIIDISDLWLYPFGTRVKLSAAQCEVLNYSNVDSYFNYISNDQEIGYLLVDDLGICTWVSSEIDDLDRNIHVFGDEVIDYIQRYINGLVFYTLILQEEPNVHQKRIEFNSEIIKNMQVLLDTFIKEKE